MSIVYSAKISFNNVLLNVKLFDKNMVLLHNFRRLFRCVEVHNTLNSAFNQIMQTFCLREVNIPDFDAVLNGMNYPLCETFIYLRLIEIEKEFLSH